MTEVNNEKAFVFNFANRKVKLNKSDFNSKAEKQIYEFFQQNTQNKDSITQSDFFNRFKLLDFGDDSEKVITEREIAEFLKQAQSQGTVKIGDNKFKTKMLKEVTEEDLIQFFNKVIELNPTEIESQKKKLTSGLKDEQGNAVFTDEILNNYQDKHDYIAITDAVNEKGEIKKGFEVFDLNNDGKMDELEKKEWGIILRLDDFSDITKKFNSQSATAGVLTAEDKLAYYQNLVKEHNTELIGKIETSSLKDPKTNTDSVTPEIKHLFSTERPEISIDDLVDENGYIKKGLELFDLNNDGKMDELERNYFSNGGKYVNKGTNSITLENFVKILADLDQFDGQTNQVLSQSDKETLYTFAQGAYQMMDSLKEFPDEIRNLYEQALYGITRLEIDKKAYSAGFQSKGTIGIKDVDNSNKGKTNKFLVASTLIHELTHFICNNLSDGKEYNVMAQEVQTFYMEHKLYEKMKDAPDFAGSKLGTSSAYIYLKKNNPELTELDIAKAVFRAEHYDWYNQHYNNTDPNILENSEYRPFGDIFEEPDNKAQIYTAGIQKAFSNLSLKDENGKELITDELKNAFSAEKPILITSDILDKNGKIKPGFEIFDFDGDGSLNANEKDYIGLITYNDLPRFVETMKRFNADLNGDKGDVISTEVRNQFNNVLYRSDLTRYYNFHSTNTPPVNFNIRDIF